jgi:hypothetical protein
VRVPGGSMRMVVVVAMIFMWQSQRHRSRSSREGKTMQPVSTFNPLGLDRGITDPGGGLMALPLE